MSSPAREGGLARACRWIGAHLRAGFTLLVSALAVWFLVRVLRDVGLARLAARLREALLAPALLSAAVTAGRFVALGWRWELLARREAPVGLRQILSVLMAGNLVSLVTPAFRIAGPILRAFYLSRETGRPRARFYGTIVADQAANFSVYGAVAAVAGALIGARGEGGISAGLGVAALTALVGGLYLSHRMLARLGAGGPSRVAAWIRSAAPPGRSGAALERAAGWWEHVTRALAESIVPGGAWRAALGLSALAYALGISAQALCFAAVGRRVAILDVAFGIAAAGFIQMLAAAPGGPGVTEASLIAAFIALGLDEESAAAGVLLARLVNYAILLPWGGACFVGLQGRYGMPPPADTPPS